MFGRKKKRSRQSLSKKPQTFLRNAKKTQKTQKKSTNKKVLKPQKKAPILSPQAQAKQDAMRFTRRSFVILTGAVTATATLAARAFHLQINKNEYYRTRSERNSLRFQVMPPVRGNIFDRNGIALTENVMTYDLVLYPAKVKDVDTLLQTLPDYIDFDEEDRERFDVAKTKSLSYRPVVLKPDLSEAQINRFMVDLFNFPGFDVLPSYKRQYPHGDVTAHLVGYINNINKKDLETLDEKQYAATLKVGRIGLEKQYESRLHGTAGYRQVETESTGRVVRVLESVDAIPGDDLHLALDLDLQRVIVNVLASEDFEGAAVALDPRNGEVLAMVSNPSYDANLFVNGISQKDYKELIESPGKPLFHRAINGRYPPASTIKPMMALAGAHYGIKSPHEKVDCQGWYRIPDYSYTKKFHCWNRRGHGKMNMYDSVVQSCDVYYYELGQALGIRRMHDYLTLFGMGIKTGIDLPAESSGILPSPEWKMKRYSKSWFMGDTVNASIGQGYMLTTPLQMAHFCAILAAKGKRYTPHLVKSIKLTKTGNIQPITIPELTPIEKRDQAAWDVVEKSLIGVIYDRRGTAKKLVGQLPFKFAGKTGTAQVFSYRTSKKIKKEDLSKDLHDNSAFVTYAPAKDPVISLSVMIENGGGGSETAAPIATKILQKYFALLDARENAQKTKFEFTLESDE